MMMMMMMIPTMKWWVKLGSFGHWVLDKLKCDWTGKIRQMASTQIVPTYRNKSNIQIWIHPILSIEISKLIHYYTINKTELFQKKKIERNFSMKQTPECQFFSQITFIRIMIWKSERKISIYLEMLRCTFEKIVPYHSHRQAILRLQQSKSTWKFYQTTSK